MSKRLENKPFHLEKNDPNSPEAHYLVLFNDEIHSFTFVIESLMEICNHSSIQAEQCAIIAHFKGKCEILKGILTELEPLQKALVCKGLITVIE